MYMQTHTLTNVHTWWLCWENRYYGDLITSVGLTRHTHTHTHTHTVVALAPAPAPEGRGEMVQLTGRLALDVSATEAWYWAVARRGVRLPLRLPGELGVALGCV